MSAVTLRLFRQSDPSRQIEERRLDDGVLILGRGSEADWPLDDPARLLSRRHCSINLVDGLTTLRDFSANGVFLGAGAARAIPDQPIPLTTGEVLKLGDYQILVEIAASPPPSSVRQADAPFLSPGESSDSLPTGDTRTEWGVREHAATPAPSSADDQVALLEAFCAGAHLDLTAFADQDAAAIMRRLGAVYQQMVIGLAGLMSERTAVKAEYLLDHTSVRPAGNNPFRWANPQRIAVDLLREDQGGFLSGPSAVKASFGDVENHLHGVFAGMRSALDATLQTLSPEAIEARAPAAGGLFEGKATATWREYVSSHQRFRQEADQEADSLVNREFRRGYALRLLELDKSSH